MKRKLKLLISLLFAGFFVSASAPEKGPKITGIINGAGGEPLPFASVALYELADTSLVAGTAARENGGFTLEAAPGDYLLQVSFLSFRDHWMRVSHGERHTDLGIITLRQDARALQEVEIVSERSRMELKLDKRVFHVGKDLSFRATNAADVLDNVPSVNVDVEGNVSLRGSGNVRILIDGRQSGLVGLSDAEGLRQLQSNMIERIEVITNPSARYDAEGEVGIINIILKKNRNEGLHGAVEVNGGIPEKYGLALNANLRKDWINFFTSYAINNERRPGSGYSFQTYRDADTTYSYERLRDHERGGISNHVRFGTDFFIGEKQTITTAGSFRHADGDNEALITYRDFDEGGLLTQTVTRDEEEVEVKENIEADINYQYRFGRKGHEWNTRASWEQSDDTETASLVEQNDQESGSLLQRTSNEEDEQEFLFQSDYIHPFGRNGKAEAGVKASLRTINNDYLVEQQETSGAWVPLDDFDNHFIFEEDIYAAYAIVGNQYDRFSWQAGLRAEYSDVTTELTAADSVNQRNYLDFFPSAHFSYKLDSAVHSLQVSYSRRLSRPRFWHLLPFYGYSDSRNFFSGNPDLEPEYSHLFEVGHLWQFEKGSVLSSVYYRHSIGVVERIVIADANGFTRTFPINLSTRDAFGVEFNFNYEIARWWNFNGNFDFYNATSEGVYSDEILRSESNSWSARATTKFSIRRKTDFQLSLRYNGPSKTTQGESLSRYELRAGISHDVLKGNGTFTLTGRDLLNTRKRRTITETETLVSESEFQWRSRQVVLSFTYRLKQSKRQQRRMMQQDGGGDDGF